MLEADDLHTTSRPNLARVAASFLFFLDMKLTKVLIYMVENSTCPKNRERGDEGCWWQLKRAGYPLKMKNTPQMACFLHLAGGGQGITGYGRGKGGLEEVFTLP